MSQTGCIDLRNRQVVFSDWVVPVFLWVHVIFNFVRQVSCWFVFFSTDPQQKDDINKKAFDKFKKEHKAVPLTVDNAVPSERFEGIYQTLRYLLWRTSCLWSILLCRITATCTDVMFRMCVYLCEVIQLALAPLNSKCCMNYHLKHPSFI